MVDRKIREKEMSTKLAEIGSLSEIQVGGETDISDEVIAAIAGVAAREIEGVASLGTSSIRKTLAERVGGAERRARGVDVEAGKREALLDINVTVVYGYSIPHLVVKVRQNVAKRVLEMLGLVTKEINIDVVGIEFPERMPGRVD
jgi:uncharacterized alkaline shock family protein YloU